MPQVLVNVNGDILTKTDFERQQIEVLRTRPELGNVTPESPVLRQALVEVTCAGAALRGSLRILWKPSR